MGFRRTRSALSLLCLLAAATPGAAYELEPGLRNRVERLIDLVDAVPTNPGDAATRTEILWEWANAVSLGGGFVPKNLPLVTVGLTRPMPGSRPNPAYLEAVDNYVRQLARLDLDPQADGSVAIEAPPSITAGSLQTIRVRWTVGSLGVAEGGAVVVSNQALASYGRLQNTDPAGANYISITSSNRDARFELDEAPIWGPYGGFRGAQPFPAFRVRGAALRAGDTVTLTFGDRSGGGPGFRVPEYSNDAIALPLHVDPGDGHLYELPLPTFAVVGGPATGVHGFAPSIVATGETFHVSVRSEDDYYDRATSEIPAYEVLLDGEPVAHLEAGEALHDLSWKLDEEGVHRFSFRSEDGRITGTANPVWAQREPAARIYWGETHGHCGFAEGQGTPEGYFRFARDDARLDFVTLSEHDIWMTDGIWKKLNEVAREFHDESRLLVFPGYEWSSPRARGGHHNVFFRHPGVSRVPVQRAPDLTELYRALRVDHDPKDVLIIPHAHQAGDWRLSDLDMESLIEIMSSHGTFEWFGQRYLESGYRLGFVGASDDHLGHPGYAPGHPANPRRRSNIFQFGGLAGAWAPRHSTDAVFDALKARSAYATSGSQRIILDARLNGEGMGRQLPAAAERTVEGRVIGTGPIRAIDLIRNGEVVASFDPHTASAEAPAGDRLDLVVGFESDSSVPFRDNPRGQRAWRGRLVVEGARILEAHLLGTPNRTSDELAVDGSAIDFDLATRGSRRTFVLTLQGASAGTQLKFALERAREIGTAPVQIRTPDVFPPADFALAVPAERAESEQILPVGGYQDRVTVARSAGLSDDVAFRFSDTGDPGDWYYVRIEQLDGHRAWSSPWWVGGEPPR